MKKKTTKVFTGGTAYTDPQTSLKLPKPLTMIGKAETAKATKTGGSRETGTVNNKKMKKAAPVKAATKKTSYAGNVVKEVKQTAKRVSNAVDKMDKKAYEAKYGKKLPAVGSSKIKEQVGQLAGAVLQGRRYNDKTGKQVMPKTVTTKQKTKLRDMSMSRKTVKKGK
jgi:hypothetical protein